jgi:hypothetical protein
MQDGTGFRVQNATERSERGDFCSEFAEKLRKTEKRLVIPRMVIIFYKTKNA